MLLEKRGVCDAETQERFLNVDFARDTHEPFLLHNMEIATARVLKAIGASEKIAVYADFDCDGIPGAALFHDFFKKIGYEHFVVYIPHRDLEGHGFHAHAVEKLAAEGVALIITIDCGIGAHAAAARARELGVDVIITDHHEIMERVPEAYAVVNPKLGDYPFPHLCGAAVAWKLVSALFAEGRARELAPFSAAPLGWEKWLLDLVALATIADLVPLSGENRALARFGLAVLRKSPRRGIRALCTVTRVRQAEISEDDIGFSFAPRINAASRMGAPELAFRLLTTHDADEAQRIAAELESLNRKRRGVVAAMVREARAKVRAHYGDGDRVAVVGDVAWKPALCGLAANAIVEERGGVVVAWGRDARGFLKGSARSDGSLSVVDLFSHAASAFEEYGGHRASGGFTLREGAVHSLADVLGQAARECTPSQSEEAAESDADVRLPDISISFLEALRQLSPFGVGNPKPIFRVRPARVVFARQFGKDMNHTEVILGCPESGVRHRAFQFFKTPMDFSFAPSEGSLVDVLATIERDTFRGPDRLALRLVDIVPPRQ